RQFAQSRWPSPAESEWHLGCQKDQKSAQEHALPAQVIGRADAGLSDRTTMVQGEQPAASAYDRTIGQPPPIGGGACPLYPDPPDTAVPPSSRLPLAKPHLFASVS